MLKDKLYTKIKVGIIKKNVAFTLLEFIVVIIIIGILATIAIPSYNKMVERSRWAGSVQLLMTFRQACMVHRAATGVYPNQFSLINIPDPSPPLPALRNQFRYFLWGGQEGGPGSPFLLACVYKDVSDPLGTICIPMGGGSCDWDPHIWIFDDGTLSSRNGAPNFR